MYFVSQNAWIWFFVCLIWCVSLMNSHLTKKVKWWTNPNKQRFWACTCRWKEMRHVFMFWEWRRSGHIFLIFWFTCHNQQYYTNDYISMKNEYSSRYSFIHSFNEVNSIWVCDNYTANTTIHRNSVECWYFEVRILRLQSIERSSKVKKMPCSNYINLNEWRLSTGKDETKTTAKTFHCS